MSHSGVLNNASQENPMNHSTSTDRVIVSHPKVTLIMILCGVVGAGAVGVVSAATAADDVPHLTVRYSPQSLGTDDGARALYRRLVTAAEAVCPASTSDRPFVSRAVQHCRDEAVARAVDSINNPRLAAVHATSAKSG
jgi:UrcA family protein